MDHARKKGRTILCPGTIGKLGSASRVHALSLDRKDMEHSSSCWDKYMTPLTRAMDPVIDSLPYLVFLCGNSTTVWLQWLVQDTHLIDELVLLLGILKFIFHNSGFHVDHKGTQMSGT